MGLLQLWLQTCGQHEIGHNCSELVADLQNMSPGNNWPHSKQVKEATLEKTTACSGTLCLFPVMIDVFHIYRHHIAVLLLNEGTWTALPNLKITDCPAGVRLWSPRAPTTQIPAVTNKYTEFTKSDSPDQSNKFLGRNKDQDFQ